MPVSPITTSYLHHTKYFLDLINELMWVLTQLGTLKLRWIFLKKCQILVVTDPPLLLVGTRTFLLFDVVILWVNIYMEFLNSALETSWSRTGRAAFTFLAFAFLSISLQRGMIWNVEHQVRMEKDHISCTIRVTRKWTFFLKHCIAYLSLDGVHFTPMKRTLLSAAFPHSKTLIT